MEQHAEALQTKNLNQGTNLRRINKFNGFDVQFELRDEQNNNGKSFCRFLKSKGIAKQTSSRKFKFKIRTRNLWSENIKSWKWK